MVFAVPANPMNYKGKLPLSTYGQIVELAAGPIEDLKAASFY